MLAGDLTGYRTVCEIMLERFGARAERSFYAAESVVNACVSAAEAVADMKWLTDIASRAIGPLNGSERALGAALFRAGRYQEALQRFEQSHEVFQPCAWDFAFLAMIHSRLGHAAEARRMLENADHWMAEADKLPPRTVGIITDGPQWQTVLEPHTTRLLRGEAEAVILYDPVFPPDPFAH